MPATTPPSRSWPRSIVAAALLAALVAGAVLQYRARRGVLLLPAGPAGPRPDPLAYQKDQGGPVDPLALAAAAAGGADLMLLQRPGDQALAGEPADLPPWSGPGAQRLAGLRRGAAGQSEQLAVWLLPGASAAQVADHYEQAALAAGFRRLTASTAASGVHNRVFLRSHARPGAAQEVLTVTVRHGPDGAYATLRLVAAPPG